jgi:hypothetical protein
MPDGCGVTMNRLVLPIGLAATSLILCVVSSAVAQALTKNGSLPTIQQELRRHAVGLSTAEIVAALKSADPEVRGLAAQELVDEKQFSAIPQIAEALRAEDDPSAKINIGFALAQLGIDEGVQSLQQACTNPNIANYLKPTAAQYLIETGHPKGKCRSYLFETLQRQDTDHGTWVQAASVVSQLKDRTTEETAMLSMSLKRSLYSDSSYVKLEGSHWLAFLKDESAIPTFEDAIMHEQDETVRSRMSADLGQLNKTTETKEMAGNQR